MKATVKIVKGMKKCTLADILFPVELRNNPMPSNKEYSMQVVGQLNGGDFLLNACSDVYELVPNQEIFPAIEQLLREAGIKFSVEYMHINNVRFYSEIQITDKDYAYTMEGTTDEIFPMFKGQHSYNGKTMYGIIFGYFRLVCENGLTIPLEEMKQYNLSIGGKHTVSIQKSLEQLKSLINVFKVDALQITKSIVAQFEMLAKSTPDSVETRITNVLKAAGIKPQENTKFSTMEYIKAAAKYEAELPNLGYNGVINDWLIYNAVNAYINDNSLNIKTPEVRQEFDSKALEYMLKEAKLSLSANAPEQLEEGLVLVEK